VAVDHRGGHGGGVPLGADGRGQPSYLKRSIGFGAFGECLALGAITFVSVIVVVAVSTLVSVPIGR
jgi:hypothetical protein